MEFKKIDDTKFQCLLYEEDLEDNNISLDDFFRNDTAKIHGLLDVVMEKAQQSIGVIMNSGVMSLQLTPQPNHSILLTISSGRDDFGNMLRQAGGHAALPAQPKGSQSSQGSIIKKDDSANADLARTAPFKPVCKEDEDRQSFAVDSYGGMVGSQAVICRFVSMQDLEQFCFQSPKTWGIKSALYRNPADGSVYLLMERTRCAKARYEQFVNSMMDYCELSAYSLQRAAFIAEHYEPVIRANVINTIKKYC